MGGGDNCCRSGILQCILNCDGGGTSGGGGVVVVVVTGY